jgi:hypothetical protein
MAKRTHGHQRTISIASWWSPLERERLISRRVNSGAKTISAYLRAAALTGPEFQMPSFETQRDLRNAVIRLAAILESLPPSKLQNETLAEAKAALGRICK